MREVAPRDLILSFVDTRITAIGIAQSYCWESPKPSEFGSAGQNWEGIGWKVRVSFIRLANQVRPKDHIDLLRPLLPDRYSPLQPNGNGLQSVYLTEVPIELAELLLGLIGDEVRRILSTASEVELVPTDDLEVWETKLEERLIVDSSIPATERAALISARVGQGLFRQRVAVLEKRCRITGVDNSTHLVASHCKPWRDFRERRTPRRRKRAPAYAKHRSSIRSRLHQLRKWRSCNYLAGRPSSVSTANGDLRRRTGECRLVLERAAALSGIPPRSHTFASGAQVAPARHDTMRPPDYVRELRGAAASVRHIESF